MALIQQVENPSHGYTHGLSVEVAYSDLNQVGEVVRDFADFLRLFEARSREYGDHAFVLGARGQFADMSRKMGKLKKGIWDGDHDSLTSEDAYEIVSDLLGHCFLTLQCLRKEGVSRRKERGAMESGTVSSHYSGTAIWDPNTADQTETEEKDDPRTPLTRLEQATAELRAAERAVRAHNYETRQDAAKKEGNK